MPNTRQSGLTFTICPPDASSANPWRPVPAQRFDLCTVHVEASVKRKFTFDATAAAAYSLAKAHSETKGYCARYVFAALAAGFGLEDELIDPHKGITATEVLAALKQRFALPLGLQAPISARNYGPLLQQLGYFQSGQIVMERKEKKNPDSGQKQAILNVLEPQSFGQGEVLIFQERDGDPRHKHGHIQLFDGKQWISDFIQVDSFWPSSSLFSEWRTTVYWNSDGTRGTRYYAVRYTQIGAMCQPK